MTLRLLFLCDEYPPGRHGGIGTAVRALARALVRQGHWVVVAGLYDPAYGGEDAFRDEGVRVHRFRPAADPRGPGWGRAALRLLRAGDRVPPPVRAFRAEVARLVRRHRIDLVVAPEFQAYVPGCARYCPPPRWPAPCVVVLHGGWTYLGKYAGTPVPAHWARMESDLVRGATAVAAVSEFAARETAALLQVHRPTAVLPNAVEFAAPPPGAVRNDLQVVYAGALWETKGAFQLMRAWNAVHAARPAARLLLAGKGPAAPVAAHLSGPARPSASFLGHVPHERLHRLLHESAVAVFPSYAETFGLAAVEAMAAGAATVFTTRGAGPEVISDGHDGRLVDPDDVPGLAAAVLHLLHDPADRRRLAANGTATVRARFDADAVAKRYADFFQHVLAPATRRARPGAAAGGRPAA